MISLLFLYIHATWIRITTGRWPNWPDAATVPEAPSGLSWGQEIASWGIAALFFFVCYKLLTTIF